jgi:hypothetical protein
MAEQANMERGSSKLVERRWKTRAFDEQTLNQLAEFLSVDGIDIVDYFPRGIPDPEVIRGTLRTNPAAFATFAERMFQLDNVSWRKLEVFPIGIPWPDVLLVNFETVPGYK